MSTYVPALKGRMGDWTYYVTVMKLGQVAKECKLAEEIHKHQELDALIQREITNRVQTEMVPYLKNQPQRFYGALIVAVYGGHPEFSPVKVAEHNLLDDTEAHRNGFGLLRFDGSQVYYALDGQHRLQSIKIAVDEKPELGQEDISVIILRHEKSKEGMERTRRLFTTLNRRAQPTSRAQNIAIDEDDAVAIVTRRLIKENLYLNPLVKAEPTNSKTLTRGKKNDPYITTLAAFYETNETLLSTYGGGLDITSQFKSIRPSYEELDEYYKYLEAVWSKLLEDCPGFKEVLSRRKPPGELRRQTPREGRATLDGQGKPIEGGNVFARPIGQFIVADVLRRAVGQGKPINEAISAVMNGGISMDVDDAPWQGLIWNPATHTIVGGRTERGLVVDLISHALGLPTSTKKRELRQKLRDVTLNKKAELLPPISWSGSNHGETAEADSDSEEMLTTETEAHGTA